MISNTRKIIRAFLASPGDLKEEREAIREVVDEFNDSWANELGYQLELIGWEETISGYGRPQHLINQDLDRCDLFLGMIWKRWGTPPSIDGKYTSGFEEEFERSMERCADTGSPEIFLFFKQIPEAFMVDPGDDLKRVLEFRTKIISGKKLLFQNFSNTRDIETLVRKSVTAYVNRVRSHDESPGSDELQAKHSRIGSEKTTDEADQHKLSPLSAEGFTFLDELVQSIRQPDSLDSLRPSDIARFRLLANSISKQGNDEINLGVHDINILFAASTEGLKLGEREIRSLLRLGFQNLANENVPVWSWYSALDDSPVNPAVLYSFAGTNEDEKTGAITVLTSLSLDLPIGNEVMQRDWIIGDWFSDRSSSQVRIAGLGYLSKCGTGSDLKIAKKEYDRSDYRTSRHSLECMLRILIRTGKIKAAQKLVVETQFESLDSKLLSVIVERFNCLEPSTLIIGLDHNNLVVRQQAMKALDEQNALGVENATRLCRDSDALVRFEAVKILLKLGKQFSDEEVKDLLVQPRKKQDYGLLGIARPSDLDIEGKEVFQHYQLDKLKKFSEPELNKLVAESLVHDDLLYFALIEKYFSKHADRLRQDIDDRYDSYFDERIKRMEAILGNHPNVQDLIEQTKELKEFSCKKFTRRGLNILCNAQKSEDLHRVRANLHDSYAGTSILDAEYLARYGDWTDISLLANAKVGKLGDTIFTRASSREFEDKAAKAITSIGKKHSISDLLSIEMPAAVLIRTISLCSESRFKKISQETLLALLNNESEDVRKVGAVLAVRSFPVKRIKALLFEYVTEKKYRYYNVIHWLDLGASMNRSDAKEVAMATIKSIS